MKFCLEKRQHENNYLSLTYPFNEYNIELIKYGNFHAKKIDKMIVFLLDFENCNFIIHAKFIDFTGEISGTIATNVFKNSY